MKTAKEELFEDLVQQFHFTESQAKRILDDPSDDHIKPIVCNDIEAHIELTEILGSAGE